MKAIHTRVTGHDLLAVERFQDDTRHMAEFLVQADCALPCYRGVEVKPSIPVRGCVR